MKGKKDCSITKKSYFCLLEDIVSFFLEEELSAFVPIYFYLSIFRIMLDTLLPLTDLIFAVASQPILIRIFSLRCSVCKSEVEKAV